MKLIYGKPAKRWGEALPLGNGQIGAMVFGDLKRERICLTENTFYSGEPEHEANQSGADQAFLRMRKLAGQGLYNEVHREAEEFIGRRENYGTNLPVGDLFISYGIREPDEAAYERGLDIETGRAWVIQKDKTGQILEEIRVSQPDKVMMITVSSDKKVDFEIQVRINSGQGVCCCTDNGLRFSADAFETMHCKDRVGVHLEGAVQIQTDGILSCQKDRLQVSDSTQTVIYLAMETDFGQKEKKFSELNLTAVTRCREAAKRGSRAVISSHESDMHTLTDGTKLEIDGEDPVSGQVPFLFQYGRYLLFCSSREDSKLPAHLQGIWNDNVACRIGWTCDMHLDINTQMNYWPAEFSGLEKSTKPLFRWIKEILVPEGRKTARISYGQEGWAAELVSNAWGYAAPYWASPIAPCPTGGVWILTHMWEHYLYTKDTEFLKEEAFPMIEEAVCFFEGYLYKTEGGNYVSGPSISPENSFLYKGEPRQISLSCTYEILMIRELFSIYLEAVQILGLEDQGQTVKVKEIYEGLPPYRILENGCIAEWSHDLPEADPQHRHTSHLLGLFPFAQLDWQQTPSLCRAAEATIQRRLLPEEGWEDTGWARSMLMLYEARLHNGEKAYEHITQMVQKLLEPNCMVYHPPTRGAGAFDHVYELDGNTGLTSCIGEMLLQSHNGRICLLPALPSAWKSGYVRRFCVRGNIEIDIDWENHKLKRAVLKSKETRTVPVVWGNISLPVSLQAGETILTPEDFQSGKEIK